GSPLTRLQGNGSSDVCSSDLGDALLAALELGRRDEVERLRRQSRAIKRILDRGADVRRRRAFATADPGDDHGLAQTHCVTGSARSEERREGMSFEFIR